jgi:ankyrin repeat protein
VLVKSRKGQFRGESYKGATALYIASQNGHLEVVQCLLAMGKANFESAAKTNGWTALMIASFNGHSAVWYAMFVGNGNGHCQVDQE